LTAPGDVAEWLRSGLQSRLHRFDSGRRLADATRAGATFWLRIWYHSFMADEHERRLRAVYDAFNRRDIEAVLVALHHDVDWPNAWEGGRVHGRDAVREYWTRQFAAIDGRVEPQSFTVTDDGRVSVGVHQVVRSLDGALLADQVVTHVYTFRDGLVERMDVFADT
jgi:ketosteroid isomerase-like protein